MAMPFFFVDFIGIYLLAAKIFSYTFFPYSFINDSFVFAIKNNFCYLMYMEALLLKYRLFAALKLWLFSISLFIDALML